jgi:hypothetical protein
VASLINFPAVSDARDVNDFPPILYRIDNAVIANPNPPTVFVTL